MTDIAALQRDFTGQVVLPGDDGYDSHRSVWNAMVDRRPAAIARCDGRDDVAAAIRFGRAHGLEIGVLCGGHSVLGLPLTDGCLLIDLTPWKPYGSTPKVGAPGSRAARSSAPWTARHSRTAWPPRRGTYRTLVWAG